MGQRRVLVIGSQCSQLPDLQFLPDLARQLYEVMIDQERGQCVPALRPEEGGGLVLNPTVHEATDVLRRSFRSASNDQATLFLAYIGHGEGFRDDFYLLPINAIRPPRSDTAVNLVQLVLEEYNEYSQVDGLVLLLDACFAGAAAIGAVSRWIQALQGQMRFQLLTATGLNPAYDGCFTRSLIALIHDGLADTYSKDLQAHHLTRPIQQRCPCQQPQLLYNVSGPDPGLWIARNQALPHYTEVWRRMDVAHEIERLTSYYQVQPVLSEIVQRLSAVRCVAVLGQAGAGKSALLAAMARPDVTQGAVPPGFLDAIAFLTGTTTSEELAGVLASQLCVTANSFAECLQLFELRTSSVNPTEWASLDALHRKIVGPLRSLTTSAPIRFALDALDQAPDAVQDAIIRFLEALATDPVLVHVRVVVTTRPDSPLPSLDAVEHLGAAPPAALAAYFRQRGLPLKRIEATVQRAEGSWLIACLLADWAERSPANFDPAGIAPGLSEIYDRSLTSVGASARRHWRDALRPVLSVLAAAGAGPVLPFPLFRHACNRLMGTASNTGLRDVLVDLRGLVVRVNPGLEAEHVGLFHPTFAEHLLQHSTSYRLDATEGHIALVAAIEELAPVNRWDAGSPVSMQRYAFERHAEHLWAVDRRSEVVDCLAARVSLVPRVNLTIWTHWFARCLVVFGPDHADSLTTRHNIAFWTGETGDEVGALRLYQELLPDQECALGPDHRDTLTTRNNIANLTGKTGDAAGALRLFQELLSERERVLGPDHANTLATRNNIAGWTGELGDVAEALRLSQALLPDQQRVLGLDHPDTLTTRHNIAYWTGKTGAAAEALRLFQELLPERERVLGLDHPDTLTTRHNIAYWTGETGDAAGALRLFRALLLDRQQVLGPDHAETLATRLNIARWTGEVEGAAGALRLFQELLPDQQRVLGPEHCNTLNTRSIIAFYTGETEGAAVALRLFQELLADQHRVLGPDHPDTLRTRNNIAFWTERAGDASRALKLFHELLADQQRVLGPDRPDTLRTRNNIASCTGELGDEAIALRLFEELLADQQRVLGPDHPDTLMTRNSIAFIKSDYSP